VRRLIAGARNERRRRDGGVGAVVIGGDFNGLGVVRSLGRHGVPICVIDDEPSIAHYSRYTSHRVRVDPMRDDESIVRSLLAAGRDLGLDGWVLYPTRDEIVAAIARNCDLLAQTFRVPMPGWSSLQWACDKRNTYRLAADVGVPVPRTWYPSDVAELRAIDGDPPYAVKPAIKEHFIYATKAKAWRADSRAELENLFTEAARVVGPGEVMIQELIPGDGRFQFAYCAFFKDGSAAASMTARRRRQHPPEFGRASTYVETVDEPLLETYSERFLRAAGYYGLAELEYKLDSRDGQYKLLDFNARPWGYNSLGARAGVDFSFLLFSDTNGQPVERRRAQAGIRWIRLVTDIPTGVVEVTRGRLNWRGYISSVFSFHVEAVFCVDDPLPGLAEIALLPHLIRTRGF
jgi:D-aspartate ligase